MTTLSSAAPSSLSIQVLLFFLASSAMMRPAAAFRAASWSANSRRPQSQQQQHVWAGIISSSRDGLANGAGFASPRQQHHQQQQQFSSTSLFGFARQRHELLSAERQPLQYYYIQESNYHQRRLSSSSLFMTAIDNDQEQETETKTMDSEWNLAGLKKETQRNLLRCHKKVSKAQQRLQKAQQQVEELLTDPDATQEQLEQCPNVEAIQVEVQELQDRLGKLSQLEYLLGEAFPKSKKGGVVLPEDVAELALDLQVDDKPPQRQPRGPSKKKGPRSAKSSRLPYRRYFSLDNIEIRVGKQAEDNDQLTLSPQHRDGSDFWMHAAGCPGSHVVIRSQGRDALPEDVVQDAAALAARQSKAKNSPVVPVSMTICRDIIKPPGAKPGLVQLKGKVRTVRVNMKEAQARLKRLDETVLVN